MRKMKSLFHINLTVQDWDKMIDFYCNKCGFDQCFVLTKADMNKMFGAPVSSGDSEIPWITYIRVAPNQYLELVNCAAKDGAVTRPANGAFHHMAFTVEDLEYTARAMAAAGAPLIHSPLDTTPISLDPFECGIGQDKCRIAWLLDPEGNAIEVMEQSGESMQEIFERERPIAD